MPGYPVTPNVPYQLTAAEGELIYFYYTYSYPGQGEHNNGANPDSYLVGSCIASVDDREIDPQWVNYYPNPVTDRLNIQFPSGHKTLAVYDFAGGAVHRAETNQESYSFDMSGLKPGVYLVEVNYESAVQRFKIIKK